MRVFMLAVKPTSDPFAKYATVGERRARRGTSRIQP